MPQQRVRWQERVLVSRAAAASGQVLTGVAVGRRINETGDTVVTVVLDAPDERGNAVLDCLEQRLVVLPRKRRDPD
jgi:hypothetical protein